MAGNIISVAANASQPATMPTGAGLAGLIAIAAVFLIPGFLPSYFSMPLPWAWLLCAAALVLFCAMVGYAINGRPAGLIIDNRNRVSLSKFQATAWSVVILTAFITAAFARLWARIPEPVGINLSSQLLAVMGISITSLVAAPVILSVKSGETPALGQEDSTAAKLGDKTDGLASVGKVYARDNPANAQWLDMFRGEEVSNAGSPDLSKVQQFLITVVVLIVYSASLWAMFSRGKQDFVPPVVMPPSTPAPTWLGDFPAFGNQIVWLIGISHAGYLAYKAAPHGASGDPTSSLRSADVAQG